MVDEYTTDASPCPEQQAKTKEKTFPQSKSEPDSCEQGSSSADHKETNPEDNPFDFNSLPRDPNAKVVNNVMQIIGSKRIHVGSVFTRTYHFEGKSDYDAKKPLVIDKKIKKLLTSKDVVKEKDINEFALHMEDGWRTTFGLLDYEFTFIEEQEYKFDGDIPGVIHWLFVDWIQNNGSKATVQVLAKVLWKSKQNEALKVWSRKFDKIHK